MAADGPHPTHRTRMSDASSFDEICVLCGARDGLGTWGSLAEECKAPADLREAWDTVNREMAPMVEDNTLGRVVEQDDLIQIIPPHKWGGCIAVVDEPKSFGCQAYVTGPVPEGTGQYYIRLNWDEFELIGAKAIFVAKRAE